LAEGTPGALAARLRPAARIDLDAVAPPDDLVTALAGVPGVRHVERLQAPDGHSRCRVESEPGTDLRAALASRVVDRGWSLYGLTPVEASLEDAFRALVAGTEEP
ncbi:MAG TPA: hypothetical protein VJ829_14325, partial [Candidatus Binatia bacterium]|nr:hypothetical protein [Candidatus Binatia bacterium]